MKRALFIVAAFVALMTTTAFSSSDQPFKSDVDSLSYAIGVDMGLNIKFGTQDLELAPSMIIENINDFIANGDPESEEFKKEIEQIERFHYTKLMPYIQAKMQLENAANKDSLPELPALYDEEFTREDIARYIGHSMAANIKDSELELNMSFFNEGIEDAIKVEDELNIDGYLRLTLDEILQLFTAYREKEMAKAEEEKIRVYNENLEANAKWLAEVEQMEGVKKTESGLLYRIDRVGNGAQPTQDSDVVLVHYVGKLRTGEIFDSSYERGESIEFPLNGVIKGWTEGMKYVRAGGQITLWIPAELAYGNNDRGDVIKAGDALEFKVELLDVNPRR